MILIAAIVLVIILSNHFTNYLIQSHIKLYPEIVSLLTKENPKVNEFFYLEAGQRLDDEVEEFFNDLLSLGVVFRIKVWSRTGTILWSDDQSIIGQNYQNNNHFRAAAAGNVSLSVDKPGKAENISEEDKNIIIEIYTPVFLEDEVIGVIEIYEADEDLQDQIKTSNIAISIIVSIAGILLYLLQFSIFYNSYRNLKSAHSQLSQTKEVTLFALASLAEARDMETGKHLERTSAYVRILAEELHKLQRYHTYFTKEYIKDLVSSSPLHDIGKVGVPDAILMKPGKLTIEEFEQMKTHCVIGASTLKGAERKLDFRSFLTIAIQIANYHHEKWDGSGYPEGLAQEKIPVSARIMALADVYDALRSDRYYKSAYSHEKAVAIIKEEKGKHFDPLIVDIFCANEDKFDIISENFSSE